MRRLDAIYNLINQLLGVDVVDCTLFYPEGTDTDTSSLYQQFINPDRLEGLTAYQALEFLIPRYHQILLTRGKAWIVPPAQESYRGFDYDGVTVGSAFTIDENINYIKIGGRYALIRKKTQAYSGINRVYLPGESPNLIQSGEFGLDDFNIITVPISGARIGFPKGWAPIQGPSLTLVPNSQNSSDSPYMWRLPFTPQPFTIWQNVPDIELLEGQYLTFSTSLRLNGGSWEFWGVLFEFRVGDYILTNKDGDPEWVLRSSVSYPDNFYGVLLSPSSVMRQINITFPPSPVTGELSYLVHHPVPLGPSSISGNETLDIDFLRLHVTDEQSQRLERTEFLRGLKGDVYEYSEGYGDGYSTAHLGAIKTDTGIVEKWSVPGGSLMSLEELETLFIFNRYSQNIDRLQGTINEKDPLSLQTGYRINHANIDYRYRNSKVDLLFIKDIPTEIDFSPDTFYVVGRFAASNAQPVIGKYKYDETGVQSEEAIFEFQPNALNMGNVNNRNCLILRNGDVIAYSFGGTFGGDSYIHRFNEDLQYQNSLILTGSQGGENHGKWIVTDENDHIYVFTRDWVGSGFNWNLRVRKYTPVLTLIWDTGTIVTANIAASGWRCVACATKNRLIISSGISGFDSRRMYSLDKNTGSVLESNTPIDRLMPDSFSVYFDNLITIHSSGTSGNIIIFDEELNVIETIPQASFGDTDFQLTAPPCFMEAWKDGTLFIARPTGSGYYFRVNPVTKEILFKYTSDLWTLVDFTNFDTHERIVLSRNSSGIVLLGMNGSSVFNVPSLPGDIGNARRAKMRYDNWQLDYFS